MLIIPAIDLKDGHCVRLKQGDMEQATVFSDDPAEMVANAVGVAIWDDERRELLGYLGHLDLPKT